MEYANLTHLLTDMPHLIFFKSGFTIPLKEGTELLRVPSLHASVPLKFGCCQGQCGTCAVKIVEGENHLSPKTREEELTLKRLHLDSFRLACQCALKGDVVIDI